MLYDDYKLKALKQAKIKRFFKKTWIPLTSGAVLIAGGVMVGVSVKGIVSDETNWKTTYVYGENYEPTANAKMTNAYFEYAKKGSDDWGLEKPTLPGEYMARATAKNNFGGYYHDDVQYFTIVPKDLTFNITSSSITYGDDLQYTYEGLLNGDSINNVDFVYENVLLDNSDVYVDPLSVSVTNQNGEDISNCYHFISVHKEIEILKRSIDVSFANLEKDYDGDELVGTASYNGLAEGDKILISDTASIKDAGSVVSSGTIKITSHKFKDAEGNDLDVTSKYDINKVSGSLTINQKEITAKSASLRKTYNGEPFTSQEFENLFSYQGALLNGHHIEYSLNDNTLKNRYLATSGSESLAFTAIIKDGEGNNVTNNYHINYEYGSFTIDKKALSLSSKDASKEYDGTSLYNNNITVVGLAETDEVKVDTFASIEKEVSQITNDFTYHVIRKDVTPEVDVTSCYDINKTTGTLAINKRNITVKVDSISETYNGNEHQPTNSNVHVMWTNQAAHENDPLAEGDVLVTNFKNSVKDITSIGGTPIEFEAMIEDASGNDVTSSYNISYDLGTIKVNKIPLTVELDYDSTHCDWDGNELVLSSSDVNILSGSLLAGDKFIVSSNVSTLHGEGSDSFTVQIQDVISGEFVNYYDLTVIGNSFVRNNNHSQDVYLTTENLHYQYNGSYQSKFKVSDVLDSSDPMLSSIDLNSLGKIDIVYNDEEMLPDTMTNAHYVVSEDSKTFIEEELKDLINIDYNSYSGINFIWVQTGTIKLDAIDITVTSPALSGSTKQVLKKSDLSLVGTLAPTDQIDYALTNEVLDEEGTKIPDVDVILTEKTNNANRNLYYNVTKNLNPLKVTAVTLKYASLDITSIFDGNVMDEAFEATSNEVELVSGTLKQGDTASFEVLSSEREASLPTHSYDPAGYNYFKVNINNTTGTVYKIDYEFGECKVNPLEVSLKATDRKVTYNGNSQSYSDVDSETLCTETSSPIRFKSGFDNMPSGYEIKFTSDFTTYSCNYAGDSLSILAPVFKVYNNSVFDDRGLEDIHITFISGNFTVEKRQFDVCRVHIVKKETITQTFDGIQVTYETTTDETRLDIGGSLATGHVFANEMEVKNDVSHVAIMVIEDGSSNDVTSNYTCIYSWYENINGEISKSSNATII